LIADDLEYFARRAEAGLALAQNASDSRAVQAHYRLANHSLDRNYGGAEAHVG
jgi:hypothetical protein